MFGVTPFGYSPFADTREIVVVAYAWDDACPAESVWADQSLIADGFVSQSSESTTWSNVVKDTIPSRKCSN